MAKQIKIKAPARNMKRTDEFAPQYKSFKSFNTKAYNPAKPDLRSQFLFSPYVKPEHDLVSIQVAEDVDGYLKRAIMRKLAVMTGKGWGVDGGDESMLEYVKRRLAQIEQYQGQPWDSLIPEICLDLIRYSNAFLIKKRYTKGNLGKKREATYLGKKKTLQPVAAYYRVLPSHCFPVYDPNTREIIEWVHINNNGIRTVFDSYDVVHFYFDKRPGETKGVPVILPALDDIRALRRLEENIELLVYQYIFPLFVVTVGDDETGGPITFQDGTSELDLVAKQIQAMATEGGIVIPSRWEVELMEIKSNLDITTYLDHFKERIFTSLGVSGLDMGIGDTANRSTSDALSKMMEDDVKLYQMFFATTFNYEIINELLLEKGSAIDLLDKDALPKFEFNPINSVDSIANQNHHMLAYQSNLITQSEARHAMGKRPPLKESQHKELHGNITGEISKNKAAATKQQPTNQHKKNQGPSKRKSSLDDPGYLDAEIMAGFNVDFEVRKIYEIASKFKKTPQSAFLCQNILKNIYLALDYQQNSSYINEITELAFDLAKKNDETQFISNLKDLICP